VHGGVIAACFDQVLNVANMLAGVAGPTVSLEVRYRKPTPHGVPLRFEADAPVVDGRQVRTTGRLRDDAGVLAEAIGVFVTLPVDRVMALTSGRR
jgi:acyl-coenzyme A thioesterase PaaI-like protein